MKYIILFTAGDPFIFRYWLRFYDREIASRVDKVYVGQSGPANPLAIKAIQALCDERGIQFNSDRKLPFAADASMQKAYDIVQNPGREGDLLLLIHSDCYVFNGKIVDQYFDAIDGGGARIVAEVKGSVITYWPGQPSKRKPRNVEQLWPCWLF